MKKITRIKYLLRDPDRFLEKARAHPVTKGFLRNLSNKDIATLSEMFKDGRLGAHVNAAYRGAGQGRSKRVNAIIDKVSTRDFADVRADLQAGDCPPDCPP